MEPCLFLLDQSATNDGYSVQKHVTEDFDVLILLEHRNIRFYLSPSNKLLSSEILCALALTLIRGLATWEKSREYTGAPPSWYVRRQAAVSKTRRRVRVFVGLVCA